MSMYGKNHYNVNKKIKKLKKKKKERIPGLNESLPSRILAHCGKDHISSKIVL